eukprot:6483202-Amphidinium_carterae.1
MNAKYLQLAAKWLSNHPLPKVMLIRLVMTPIMSLLSEYLQRSGEEWKVKEMFQHCKSEQQASKLSSSFMAYVALTSEQGFYQAIQELLVSDDWKFLPRHCYTIEMQCLAFRMISRMGALVWQLLVEPARQCPFKLFRLLIGGEKAAGDILATPSCLQDNFSRAFLRTYPGVQVLSKDSLMSLNAIAEKHHVDTVQLEWGHGRVNRTLSISNQTHVPSFEYVNAKFMAQKHGERWKSLETRGCAMPAVAKPCHQYVEMKADEAAPMKSSKKRGGGGMESF